MSLNSTIRKILKEQSEDWVDIDPEDYLDLLKYVNGDGSQISKFKQYRGKKIRITGDLDIPDDDSIINIDSIDYVDGDLDISHTNISFFDENKVKGNFRKYGSEMEKIEERKRVAKILEHQDELRQDNAWEIGRGNGEEPEETEAIYKVLESFGTPQPLDENEEEFEDKYFLAKDNYKTYGDTNTYTWYGGKDQKSEWVAYNDRDINYVVKEYIENLVDEVGTDAFRDWVWENNLDKQYIRNWLYDSNSEMVEDDPESWGIQRTLSKQQQQYVEIFENKIKKLEERISNEQLTEEQKNELYQEIEDVQTLIDDINEDPQGDYDEDEIEDEIERLIEDDMYDFPQYLKDHGFPPEAILDYVDMDGVIETVIGSDGYGHLLNGYDGTDHETKINGTWYHVMRIS